MKLFVKSEPLFLEMFKHLVGNNVMMVIGGRPESVRILAVVTGSTGSGFEVEGPGGRRFVPVDNIWEMQA